MPPKRLPATYAKDVAEFGRQVRERREARGWSQDELVKKAKHAITKEPLQRVEKGLASRDTKSLANPQLATLLALASVLESPIVIDMNRPAGRLTRAGGWDGPRCSRSRPSRPGNTLPDVAGRIRIVIAEPAGPAEGDDRGAQVVARALRDAGMEVVYTGLHQTPEQIVQTAIQEDADAVGLPGALDPLRRRVIALLADRDAADVLVLEDGPGSDDDIVARVRDAVSDRVAPDTG